MATMAWKIYAAAKLAIGTGGNAMTAQGVTLGVGVFKMSLHRAAASANIIAVSTRVLFSSIGNEITAQGGYAANGRNLLPTTGKWVAGRSAKEYKFTYTVTPGLVFTANGAALSGIKFALIRTSNGAGTGRVVCYCSLSSSEFSIASPNTLTITPHANGVFTMA